MWGAGEPASPRREDLEPDTVRVLEEEAARIGPFGVGDDAVVVQPGPEAAVTSADIGCLRLNRACVITIKNTQ